MSNTKLDRTISEAIRFLSIATDYQNAMRDDAAEVAKRKKADPNSYAYHQHFPAKSGATRRASMDLTRALADLRKPGA